MSGLSADAVAVLPADTVYGLACSARNIPAVARLYGLKDRVRKPGTLIAADIQQLADLGIPMRYLKPVAQYWPGPISVVVPSVPALSYLDMGIGTLAVRIPSNAALAHLLQATGPLITSSANPPGLAPAQNIQQAIEYFGDRVDFYVDGGTLSGPPSTVIRIVDDAVEVLREGAVRIDPDGSIRRQG